MGGGTQAPPQPQPDNPTHPSNDPVAAALQQALTSLAGPPDHAAALAPFGDATNRVQDAYAQALPKIAAAYGQLRDALGKNHEQTLQEQAAIRGQSQRDYAAASSRLGGFQDRSVNALKALFGASGADAFGGDLAAAQSQAGSNMADLSNTQHHADQLADANRATGETMYSDRVAGSHQQEAGANDKAKMVQDELLGKIAAGKAVAESNYQKEAQAFAAEQNNIRMKMAEHEAAKNDPLNRIKELTAQAGLAKTLKGLGSGGGGDLPQASDFGPLAEKSPTAFKALTDIISRTGAKGDRMSAEKALNGVLGQASYDPKSNTALFDGKHIDIGVIRSWLDHYYTNIKGQGGNDAISQLMQQLGG